MAKRRPVEPGSTGDDGGPRRDRRGRFTKGGTRGGGAASHAYVQRRAALAKALQEAVSPTAFRRLVQKLYDLAMAGNVQAGMFLITQLAGKAPEHPSPLQMTPTARVTIQPAPSIEQIATGLQRTLENFETGVVTGEEARVSQALLATMLEVRKAGELDAKVSELLAILKERGDDAQSS